MIPALLRRLPGRWPSLSALRVPQPRVPLSLFWRTFCLLCLLLAAGIFAWTQTFRALEAQPRALHAAQQIASLVNLTRVALKSVDGINRVALSKGMADPGSVKLMPREPDDRWTAFEVDAFTQTIGNELRLRLGGDTLVAKTLNDRPGLWVGFSIDGDPYWVLADSTQLEPLAGSTWFVWIGIALLATALASAAIARAINQPLRDLSAAAARIRKGDFSLQLDETVQTSEVREVNRGFNHMAHELAQIEADRAVMLAGISHDVRTPLARLRLEAELSVADEEARRHMAQDIDQVDTILGKFMDYARPFEARLHSVDLAQLVGQEIEALRDTDQLHIRTEVPADLRVLADHIELGRVLQNLLENAARYGRSPDTHRAEVRVAAVRHGALIVLTVRDHGRGVEPAKLERLTTPFFRGDAARTSATGAGLGLAIVDKAVQRMGGELRLRNADPSGLIAEIRLPRAL